MQQITAVYVNTFFVIKNLNFDIMMTLIKGTTNLISSMNKFFSIWKSYGSKLGLGEEIKAEPKTQIIDSNLQDLIVKLSQNLSWFAGQKAYELIKIEPKKIEPPPKEEGDKDAQEKKKKKFRRDEALKMVVQSNLLSGGMESEHLNIITKESKEKLIGLARIMEEDGLVDGYTGVQEEELGLDDPCAMFGEIIVAGKNEDVDLTIKCL